MSASTAKAARRDIRRAFGEEALDTINQHGEVLQSVVVPRLMTLANEFSMLSHRVSQQVTLPAGWPTMTRTQRLRWLLDC